VAVDEDQPVEAVVGDQAAADVVRVEVGIGAQRDRARAQPGARMCCGE
jgi:hypothetical protein